VTWHCTIDTRIQNRKKNCAKPEQWKGGAYAAATGAGVLHTNEVSGEVNIPTQRAGIFTQAGVNINGIDMKREKWGE